jgi:prefoldin subunit 5
MKTSGDYERFVVDVLKPQLASFVKNCDEVNEEFNGYEEVKALLMEQEKEEQKKMMKKNKKEEEMGTVSDEASSHSAVVAGPTVNIGENCFVQSEIYDKDEIYIHIGMGFHVSLPKDKALPLIEERQHILTAKLEHLQNRCQEIAAYINEILPIISELQRIESVEEKK